MKKLKDSAKKIINKATSRAGAATSDAYNSFLKHFNLLTFSKNVTFRASAVLILDRVLGRSAMATLLSVYLPLRQFLVLNRRGSQVTLPTDETSSCGHLDCPGRRRSLVNDKKRGWDFLSSKEKDHTIRYMLFFSSWCILESAIGNIAKHISPLVRRLLGRLGGRFLWNSDQLKLFRAAIFVLLWTQPTLLLVTQKLVMQYLDSKHKIKDESEEGSAFTEMRQIAKQLLSRSQSGFWDDIESTRDISNLSKTAANKVSIIDNGAEEGIYASTTFDCHRTSENSSMKASQSPRHLQALRRRSLGSGGVAGGGATVTWQSAANVMKAANKANADIRFQDVETEEVIYDKTVAEHLKQAVVDQEQRQREIWGSNDTTGTIGKPAVSPIMPSMTSPAGTPAKKHTTTIVPVSIATPVPPPQPKREHKPRVSSWLGSDRLSIGYNRLKPNQGSADKAEQNKNLEEFSMTSLDFAESMDASEKSTLPLGAEFGSSYRIQAESSTDSVADVLSSPSVLSRLQELEKDNIQINENITTVLSRADSPPQLFPLSRDGVNELHQNKMDSMSNRRVGVSGGSDQLANTMKLNNSDGQSEVSQDVLQSSTAKDNCKVENISCCEDTNAVKGAAVNTQNLCTNPSSANCALSNTVVDLSAKNPDSSVDSVIGENLPAWSSPNQTKHDNSINIAARRQAFGYVN